jgi:hypothetical protein
MERDKEFDVGDQVQITQGSEHWVSGMDQYVGKIATIKKVEPGSIVDHIYRINIDNGDWKWIPQSGHFIHAPQHGLDQKDELLYRAEQMFSVGTKFCPAHQVDENEIQENTHCIITDDTSFEFDKAGNIMAMVGSSRWFQREDTKYGNTSYDRVVYLARDKKWAYIYPKEKGFKIGDKVMITHSIENWCPEMDEFIGKIATLTRTKGKKGTHFGIDLDNSEWAWSDKDGHFRKPTEEELVSTEPTPIKHEYEPDNKVYLKETHHGVSAQIVTIHSCVEHKGKPHYTLVGWAGKFPEELLEPTVEESEPKQDLLAMAFVRYPVGTKYNCITGRGRTHTVDEQSFSLCDADTIYGEYGKGCLYKNGVWAEIVQVAVKHKFKVGDWVIGNHRANGFYAMTNEGWSGQVTNVRDSDGYIDVKGKYNDDNDHYLRLDPDRFDLTTEGELMALVAKPSYTLTATTTPASYTLTSVDSGEKLRIDSSGSIGFSQPVVQSTFKVKKVSFNRI